MSQEEEVDIRYLLQQISKKQDLLAEKQEQHVAASNTFREEVKTKLATIDTHFSYTKDAVETNTVDIKSLTDSRTRQRGAMWAFGLIWTGILTVLAIFKGVN